MAHGGRRTGAGRPKGRKDPHTLEKEAANDLVRQLVTQELEPLLRAQIAKAKGISHFVLRNKATGKFERVTDPKRIVKVLNGGKRAQEVWEIWTRDPDTGAFTDLMNRALGKPKETLEVENKTDWDAFRLRIAATRKRLKLLGDGRK